MTDQTTTDTDTDTDRGGPVQPAAPDVSALGGRRRRADRLAAAQQRAAGAAPGRSPAAAPAGDSNLPVTSGDSAPKADVTAPQVSESQTSSASPPSSAPPKPAASAIPEAVQADSAAAIAADPSVADLDDEADAGRPTPAVAPAENAAGWVAENEEPDDDLDDDETEQFSGGKVTLQAYVPDDVATQFQRMQTTGRTAEVIVLTAVRNCVDRIPKLVEDARGPVHTDGLFAGLPVLDRKPGRRAAVKPNSSRIQYQVSPQFLPDLKQVAKKHRLKLSVLVRLALGAFFSVPVRMGRAKK